MQSRMHEIKSPHSHVFAGAYAQELSTAGPQVPLGDTDGCANFSSEERPVGVCGQSIDEPIYDVLVPLPCLPTSLVTFARQTIGERAE
jgi:hypothetical protein